MPRAFSLSTLAADVLGEHLGINLRRFPFELEHHGATVDERSELRTQAWNELSRRGLVDHDELDQDVEAALLLLHTPRIEIATTYLEATTEQVHRARTVASGRTGVRATQLPEHLRVEFIDPRGIARLCTDPLPEEKAGTLEAATINASEGAVHDDDRSGEDAAGASWLSRAENTATVRRGGPQLRAAQRILGQPTHRIGYFFVTGRGHDGGAARMPAIGWRDTETGRYSVTTRRNNDGAEWNTFAGADKPRLNTYLTEQLNALQSE
ncbi:ESX secretion-associated protein EspG [Actinopolyspora saharensis]|uniref:EspG family protein n=1 Tax=Actinopolyspora saharensis TaxID=995062 RepID=A0A1H1E2V2_9ACTN|nr:ESX secretion-associated protein EspG [Actinopolyspora saharensis]SDQ83017.1 EspG family protein [Actinopolyspora saharensis]